MVNITLLADFSEWTAILCDRFVFDPTVFSSVHWKVGPKVGWALRLNCAQYHPHCVPG